MTLRTSPVAQHQEPMMPLFRWRRPAVDDAYTTWLDAHSRCSAALEAWRKAAPRARAAAYVAYLAELAREELAAAELERLNPPRVAA
jgi:hypothetical protein